MIKPIYIAIGVGAAVAAFYLRKIKASKQKVTVIGDSLSLLPGGYQDILAKKYDLVVSNLSKVGQTSAAALARYKLATDKPGIVFIFLGANDSYSGTNKRFTLDNIKQIQKLASGRGARTIIIPGYLGKSSSDQAKAYNDLKNDMSSLPGIVVPLLRIDSQDLADNIHLTKSGQYKLAKLIDIWALR